MKFGTPVKQLQPFNYDYFHDNWCPICDFMGFWIFWKMSVVALTFVLYTDQGTLVLNLAKIDWSVQIFSDFEFFENFLKIVQLKQISIYWTEILCVNALILSGAQHGDAWNRRVWVGSLQNLGLGKLKVENTSGVVTEGQSRSKSDRWIVSRHGKVFMNWNFGNYKVE